MTVWEEALAREKIPFRADCPLAGFSTFRIGGPADLAVFPRSVGELIGAFRVCRAAGKQPARNGASVRLHQLNNTYVAK